MGRQAPCRVFRPCEHRGFLRSCTAECADNRSAGGVGWPGWASRSRCAAAHADSRAGTETTDVSVGRRDFDQLGQKRCGPPEHGRGNTVVDPVRRVPADAVISHLGDPRPDIGRGGVECDRVSVIPNGVASDPRSAPGDALRRMLRPVLPRTAIPGDGSGGRWVLGGSAASVCVGHLALL